MSCEKKKKGEKQKRNLFVTTKTRMRKRKNRRPKPHNIQNRSIMSHKSTKLLQRRRSIRNNPPTMMTNKNKLLFIIKRNTRNGRLSWIHHHSQLTPFTMNRMAGDLHHWSHSMINRVRGPGSVPRLVHDVGEERELVFFLFCFLLLLLGVGLCLFG